MPRLVLLLVVLLLPVADVLAGPPALVTDGGLLIGEWQDDANGIALQLLPGKKAILEVGLGSDAKNSENRLGSYKVVRPGVWSLTVQGIDKKWSTYTMHFDQSHRLLVYQGSAPSMVLLRSGIRFRQLDRDGDGLLTKEEARGTPLEGPFDEFANKERQVDRSGYQQFLQKYPHIAGKR